MREVIEKKFESAEEYLAWASDSPTSWQGRLASRDTSSEFQKFCRTKNYEEARHLALYGWKEGLRKIGREVSILQQMARPKPVPIVRHDVAGERPNPARAAASVPDSMIHRDRSDEKTRPIITFEYLSAYPAYTDPDTVIRFGAALTVLIDDLEAAGYRVEVIARDETYPSYYNAPSLSFAYPVKTAGQAVDLGKLAFWLAHPSALRRIGFSAIERMDYEYAYHNGYGRPHFVTKAEPGVTRIHLPNSDQPTMDFLVGIYDKVLENLMQEQQDKSEFWKKAREDLRHATP